MSYQYNGLIQFVAAEQGDWNIISMSTLSGEALAPAKNISMAYLFALGSPISSQQNMAEKKSLV